MKNIPASTKKAIVRVMKNIISDYFGEHTPPEVKSSEKNRRVAVVMLALDELLEPISKS